jgi:hypothetical protein
MLGETAVEAAGAILGVRAATTGPEAEDDSL